jgi:hypothetical protein
MKKLFEGAERFHWILTIALFSIVLFFMLTLEINGILPIGISDVINILLTFALVLVTGYYAYKGYVLEKTRSNRDRIESLIKDVITPWIGTIKNMEKEISSCDSWAWMLNNKKQTIDVYKTLSTNLHNVRETIEDKEISTFIDTYEGIGKEGLVNSINSWFPLNAKSTYENRMEDLDSKAKQVITAIDTLEYRTKIAASKINAGYTGGYAPEYFIPMMKFKEAILGKSKLDEILIAMGGNSKEFYELNKKFLPELKKDEDLILEKLKPGLIALKEESIQMMDNLIKLREILAWNYGIPRDKYGINKRWDF